MYRFQSFTLDPHRHRLIKDGDVLNVPESAIRVLEVLVANAPKTVEKSTLMDVAWPDSMVVPDNLVQAIHTIRATLGGDAREPTFVQTVHRRGYRFVAPVTLIQSGEDAESAAPHPPSSKPTARSRGPAVGILVALLVLAGVVLGLRFLLSDARSPKLDIRALAVLPMANLSGDPDQEYFADGMTDALITELARNDDFDVISRTSVMKFRNTRLSVPEIANRLGVDAIVEGTVTRANGRIRVIAQLVDSQDHHIWGENYESKDQDILRLQRNLAQAVAQEIGSHIRIRQTEDLPPVVNPKAHDAFLRGKHVLRNRDQESFLRALTFFQKSVELDPEYAPAYAGLADAFNLMANYGFSPSPQARSRAREMAMKAIELDPDLAEAHLALALVLGEFDWAFDQAEREFNKALRLRSSSAEIRARHAQLLLGRGRLSQALDEIQFACRLDPLSEIINSNVGWFQFFAGRPREAEESLLDVLNYNPDFTVAWYYLGSIYDSQGRFDEAIEALEKAVELSHGSSYADAALAHALAGSGNIDRANTILNQLLEQQRTTYVSPIALAVASFGLNQRDQGFSYLNQALEERKGWFLGLQVEPVMNPLRDDPRYLELVRRVGLPPLDRSHPG
jgi:TolB-like protein/DNA-binding winged helix-turn-helix (wHTH) protein/tetratricopeptide (TPR) repeat protein